LIPVVSVHTATLTVPVSANPAEAVVCIEDPIAHTIAITARGDTPAQARQKIRQFLQDALAAVDAP
jgi:hypothetical protein